MLVDLSEDEFEEEVIIADVEARVADPDFASRVIDRYIKAQPLKDIRGGKVSAPAGKDVHKFWELCATPRSIGGRWATAVPERYGSGTHCAATVASGAGAAASFSVEISGDAELAAS